MSAFYRRRRSRSRYTTVLLPENREETLLFLLRTVCHIRARYCVSRDASCIVLLRLRRRESREECIRHVRLFAEVFKARVRFARVFSFVKRNLAGDRMVVRCREMSKRNFPGAVKGRLRTGITFYCALSFCARHPLRFPRANGRM